MRLRLALAVLLGLGCTGPVWADLTTTGTVAPAVAAASPSAWRLRLPGKSPLVLPRLGALEPALYAVKDAALFGGLTVRWSPSARLLELESPDKSVGRLLLGEPVLYVPGQRLALAGPLRLQDGAPALDEASLRQVLGRLCAPAPAFEAPSPEEAAAAQALVRPVTASAEPLLMPSAEPVLEPLPAANAPVVAARPLSGRTIRTIVVDAGHGGYDPGAHGPRGLREKDVCLDIARRLRAELLKRAPDLVVVLTRDSDDFVSLRERTEIANKADADLFVSIHNNASPNRNSHGTQVFFYDSQTSDRAAADLVAREDSDANQLEVLMTDLAKMQVRDQSIGMADQVQGELSKTLALKHRDLSYAPFYVLARTKMPAILVEVAFITNPAEERKLADLGFRQDVAQGLAAGMLQYRRLASEGAQDRQLARAR